MSITGIRSKVYIGLFLLTFTFSADAYNGSIAFAFPVDNIEVDGIFDDWPAHFQEYSIDRIRHRTPSNIDDDCPAYYKVGYNKGLQSIYIPLVVQDELSHKTGFPNKDMEEIYREEVIEPMD